MAEPSSVSDMSASQQPRIFAATSIAYGLTVIAVVLRFISRKLAGAGLWWDDWLTLPPTVGLLSHTSKIVRQLKTRLGTNVSGLHM